MTASPRTPQDKIADFFQRVDQMIASTDPEVADIKLLNLENEWIERLGEFHYYAQSDRPMPKAYEGAVAADFHETIAGLAKRRAALKVMA